MTWNRTVEGGGARLVLSKDRLGIMYSLMQRKVLADQQLTTDSGAKELVEVLIDVGHVPR